MVPYFDFLQEHYAKSWPPFTGLLRKHMLASLLVDLLPEQCPNAVTIVIQRIGERFCTGAGERGSVIMTGLQEISGFSPKACNHDCTKPFHALQGGSALHAAVVANGPLRAAALSMVMADDKIDLVKLCVDAASQDLDVLFLGEWDGELSATCAKAVTKPKQPRIGIPLAPSTVVKRRWGKEGFTYEEFIDYAELEFARHLSCRPVMPTKPYIWKIGLNSAFMWHSAHVN
jgi:hypothetical protein